MHSAGIDVAFAHVRQPVIDMARRAGLLEALGEARTFQTIEAAIQSFAPAAPHPPSRRRTEEAEVS